MAQRLATEYKKVSLTLNKGQLAEFIRLFRLQKARIEEKVLENGDIDITLFDKSEEIHLTFERSGDLYLLTGHCTFKDRNLAETMRKAIASFKGEGIVHRIFSSFKIEYRYEQGTVLSIREINDQEERMIFENTDFSFHMQRMLANNDVENEINHIRRRVDELLDQRLQMDRRNIDDIDRRLLRYAKRLNQLEA